MRIISINVSMGKTVSWNGKPVRTGIFKTPVSGSVAIRTLGLQGDEQADLRVHGGADKAVYSYDLEDYFWWKRELGQELTPGAFGENLTTQGLLDRDISVGDILKAGSAILQAVQPRLPCYKLGLKFQDNLMPKRFAQARRWGIYFRVLQEGVVAEGDILEFIKRDPGEVRISDLAHVFLGYDVPADLIDRALDVESLPSTWRETLLEHRMKLFKEIEK